MQGNQEDKKADILNTAWNIPHEIWFIAWQLTILETVRDPISDGQAIKYSDAWMGLC